MVEETKKILSTAVVLGIVHFAIKDIFTNVSILQKMYFPKIIIQFLKDFAYEHQLLLGRCTFLQIKCGVSLTILGLLISFSIYYAIAWIMSYIKNR